MQDPGFPVQGGHQRLRRLPPGLRVGPGRVPEGQVVAIIVYGPCRFFGLFGRGEEFYIPWECIQRIGDDIILIDKPFQRRDPRLERKRRKRC